MKKRTLFLGLAAAAGVGYLMTRNDDEPSPRIPAKGAPAVPSLGDELYARAIEAPDAELGPYGKLVLGRMLEATGAAQQGASLMTVARGSIEAGAAPKGPSRPIDLGAIDARTNIVALLVDVGLPEEGAMLKSFIARAMPQPTA